MKKSSSTDIENAAREAVRVIAAATGEAARTISIAAEAAARVVAQNATDAAKVVATTNAGDHDLLQRVDTKVDALQIAVNKLADRDSNYITKQDTKQELNEHALATDKTTNDHEARIRYNEGNITRIMTYGSAAMVLIGLAEFVLLKILK